MINAFSGQVRLSPVSTTIREDEVDEVHKLGVKYHVNRASIVRAMLRYTLEHRADFVKWLNKNTGMPEMPDSKTIQSEVVEGNG